MITPSIMLEWGLAVLVQSTLVFAIAFAADRLLARAWPRLRMTIWLLALVRLVLPPDLASPWSVAALVPTTSIGVVASSTAVPAWPLVIWGLGAVTVGAAALLRERRLRASVLDGATPAPAWLLDEVRRAATQLGLRVSPLVRITSADVTAAVVGTLRPVIVVSRGAVDHMDRDELRHVILHEVAHVRRRDPLQRMLVSALVAVWWFQPLAWLAARKLAAVRELCCDATVADTLREATGDYRRTLLAAARRLAGQSTSTAALGLLRGDEVIARLRHLERPSWRRPVARRASSALLGVVMAVFVLPAAARVVAPDLRAAHEVMERAAAGE